MREACFWLSPTRPLDDHSCRAHMCIRKQTGTFQAATAKGSPRGSARIKPDSTKAKSLFMWIAE